MNIICDFINQNFWTPLVSLIAIFLAYKIGKTQNLINKNLLNIQDVVEISVYFNMQERKIFDISTHEIKVFYYPIINLYNVGTRLLYIEKYVFNGKEYKLNSYPLPSVVNNSINPTYWIDLPANGEIHVSIDVYYFDLENRKWISKIICDFNNNTWKIQLEKRSQIKDQ